MHIPGQFTTMAKLLCVRGGKIVYLDVVPIVELARMVGAGVARDAFAGAAFQKPRQRMSHMATCSNREEGTGRKE